MQRDQLAAQRFASLSRRRFLRGIGACMAVPALESLLPSAAHAAAGGAPLAVIDAAGKLITGESFNDIRDLKKILKNERRVDFYRCLTEKLLIYALGRGLEYYDVQTVDQIVDRLEVENGKFSALLTGIIESAPFQRRRSTTSVAQAE